MSLTLGKDASEHLDLKAHPLFPSSNETDVTFQSCDGVLFHLQRRQLETHVGAFPSAEFSTGTEYVGLTETAEVLAILFQFVGLMKKQPNLKNETFSKVAEVAEAAEKYEVYSAMNFCQLWMRHHLPAQALPVLLYALKHGYPDIVNEVAPIVVFSPLLKVIEGLPDEYLHPWVRYHSASYEELNKLNRRSTTSCCVECWTSISEKISSKLVTRSHAELGEVLEMLRQQAYSGWCGRSYCKPRVVQQKIYDDLLKIYKSDFSTYLTKSTYNDNSGLRNLDLLI